KFENYGLREEASLTICFQGGFSSYFLTLKRIIFYLGFSSSLWCVMVFIKLGFF
ncbi:hypothetical protein Leryth_027067, partial [Lithospermum erythrorhizon]